MNNKNPNLLLNQSPEKLLRHFKQDGFVSATPLFDANTIQTINKNLDRFIRDIVPNMPPERVYYEDKNNQSSIKQMQKLFEYDDYFQRLMCDSVIHKLAKTLLQDDVVPINMQYFNKPPTIGAATPAHQDGYYFHLTPCEAVTGWLALEAVDQNNGCIHYVRGSNNRKSFRPHGQTGVLGFSQGITDFGTEEDKANTVAFPGPAGTFLMHHARTIHFAGANQSATRSRRALGFIYYAASAKEDATARDAYQQKLNKRLKQNKQI